MRTFNRFFSLLFLVIPLFAFAQGTVTFNDASVQAGQTVTLTSDNEYLLDGLVYVEEGAELHIEAGTVIKAKQVPSTGDNTSALIITKGAKIYAEGSASQPIIFTSELDDINNPSDLTAADRGLWGGVILLGNAIMNNAAGSGQIEGIDPNEPRAAFGGSDDTDNSGVMRYVSIRHGGSELSAGDEINGLTFGAVGNGTVIEYIEVFSNLDDGYEWFGGTVNTKYLVSAFCGDDGFDYDIGFRGKGQFWFAIQGTDFGGRTAEMDGGTNPEDGTPYAMPILSNATYIGPGTTSFPQGDGAEMLIFRDNAGGKYYNSIFTDYNGANGGNGIKVEDLADGQDSRQRLEDGDLALVNNIWWAFGAGNDLASVAPQSFVADSLAANNNQIVDPQLNGISRNSDRALDPRPAASGPAASGAMAMGDSFFDNVDYLGAFAPGAPLWTNNWTALYQEGHTTGTIVLNDDYVQAGQTVYLMANNTYILDGLVYVEEGAELHIEAGTVIKAKQVPSTGDNTSALIITKGAKIYAEGSASQPIIFTSELDDINNPSDLTAADRGLWGGVILLGNAIMNNAAGSGQIEGIDPNEPRAAFGGSDDTDNSGVMRYVSIRHGGSELSAGDEINGLTFGAVGNGTVIEYIEVFSNLDDGYEWFGGTVNTKYLVSAFCGDDGFDYDIGFRGKGQFWFAIQGTDFGGRTAEMDGGTNPEDGTPYAMPILSNATYIGPGTTSFPQGDGAEMLIFRDNAGGKYYNSIFTDYNGANGGNGIKVEDLADGQDSRQRLEDGDLALVNNIWWAFGAGNDLASVAPQSFVADSLAANNNQIVDPQLNGISRNSDRALDPRPAASGPAASGAMAMGDSFFDNVDYIGAFAPNAPLWTDGWTALSHDRLTTGIEEEVVSLIVPATLNLEQNYPNPFNPETTINFSLPVSGNVDLAVYNLLGQKVASLASGFRNAGTYTVRWNAAQVSSGWYIYSLRANGQVMNRKMLLLK